MSGWKFCALYRGISRDFAHALPVNKMSQKEIILMYIRLFDIINYNLVHVFMSQNVMSDISVTYTLHDNF